MEGEIICTCVRNKGRYLNGDSNLTVYLFSFESQFLYKGIYQKEKLNREINNE
jgi:hypothetical protein